MTLRAAVPHALFTVFVLLLATPVQADPIVITSGSAAIYADQSSGFFDLFGDMLHASAGGTAGVSSATGEGRAGTVQTLNGGIFTNFSYEGVMTIGGTQFSIPGYTGPVWTSHLGFTTGTFVLPSVDDAQVRISTPFSMTGTLAAATSSAPGSGQLFSVDVTGTGTASVVLFNHTLSDGSHYFTNPTAVLYTFDSSAAPSPTPEPGTWLLTMTAVGFAVVLAGRRWRDS